MNETMQLWAALSTAYDLLDRLEPGELGLSQASASILDDTVWAARHELKHHINKDLTTSDLKFALGID